MEKISAAPENSASVLHALSSLLETQESLYVEENGHSCPNTTRASHHIGRLGNLPRGNDEFFDLVSSKILAETRYSTAVQAAAARLLMSCSPAWIENENDPHVFDEPVMENIKGWLMDESVRCSGEERNWKHGSRRREATDSEMLKAYSTGLLAVCLASSEKVIEDISKKKAVEKVVEDVLTSGLSGKLMRFLRIRTVGETSTSKKDGSYSTEGENANAATCYQGRERQLLEATHDNLKVMDERSLDYQSVDRNDDKSSGAQQLREDFADLGVLSNVSAEAQNSSGSPIADGFTWERKENDDCLSECRIGTKDISNLVKKAVGAAEAEARAANAPPEAIKVAGDAAAEVVKSAAFEEFKSTNNDEAAVLASSRVAFTVVDATNAVERFRRTTSDANDSVDLESTEKEANEETEEYFIPDVESLAQLREKYCIQCIGILGGCVGVLGPVLQEEGVDVCLLLLERSSKGASKAMSLLPDVMKLICSLGAHRKFAELFVYKDGMEKLLAVPPVEHTYFGLSSCLFTIVSVEGIMELVCALPSGVVPRVVGLAIQHLECSQDQARESAALFFRDAFVFRDVIDAFDEQHGLQKSLSLLNKAASVRSGGNSGSLNLSTSEKQTPCHTCFALQQYVRGHFHLLVESVRANRNNRSLARNLPSARAAYKPLDLSNQAMDAILLQLQKERKLGPAFARASFPAVDKFLELNGHITMLELCQVGRAPPVDYLVQFALGVLHIVTLVNDGRKMIVNATLSNNRAGIAVILDAAYVSGTVVPEVTIMPALKVLINLVCPPPSRSNKPPPLGAGNIQDRSSNIPSHGDQRERNGESSAADQVGRRSIGSATQASVNPTATSGLVGDRRISLRFGAGFAGLATQMEQVYTLAREAVSGGLMVLLRLLERRTYSPPDAIDCVRALACRVLIGLARDDKIAHNIVAKLQDGKALSELIRDSGGQTPGTEQSRWQAELAQVAIELIGIVTNSGRASTLTCTDAATPTLRRIERAAIAAATPITYHSRELLLLIHEHLQASGLAKAADALLEDAQLTPSSSSLAPQETPFVQQIQWPSASGFLSEKSKATVRNEDGNIRCRDSSVSAKKKHILFSPSFGSQSRSQPQSIDSKKSKQYQPPSDTLEKEEPLCKTPAKRKLSDLKDIDLASSGKRLNTSKHEFRSPVCSTPANACKIGDGLTTPFSNTRDIDTRSTPFSSIDYIGESPCPSSSSSERSTLDSIVVQYLKQQHRQCPAPITTLPPLSLLEPHVCREPKRCLDAPSNVTARIGGSHQFRSFYGGVHGNRKDRQFVYSRFRPWRTCRDDAGALLTCVTFLGNSGHVAVGTHDGELKIFDSDSGHLLESCATHQAPLTLVQSHLAGETQLVLSSSCKDVCLWDASSISGGPIHTLEGRKAAKFSNSSGLFATLTTDIVLPQQRREILLYDVQTCQVTSTLSDTTPSSTGRANVCPPIHFSPCDTMLLWNGLLWDRRQQSDPVHRFDKFTDYGGGGFHPAGNEVIINSEVWDLRRKFKLLRSVPSLDQTTITFNARGDVIYAILRRNLDDVMSALHTPRRVKHPLFPAFRTVDAVNYSEIATVPVDRCVLDFASEPTDSFLGLITMDDDQEMFSSARVYEIGRRRPTDDDSDPDDAESEVEDENEDEDEDDPILRSDFGGDGDSDEDDDLSNDDDIDLDDSDDEVDGGFVMDGVEFGGGGEMMEMMTEGDGEDDDDDDDDDGHSRVLEWDSSGEEDFMR